MAKLSQEELLKAVEEMSVLELSEFVKKLEEKFGVSRSRYGTSRTGSRNRTGRSWRSS